MTCLSYVTGRTSKFKRSKCVGSQGEWSVERRNRNQQSDWISLLVLCGLICFVIHPTTLSSSDVSVQTSVQLVTDRPSSLQEHEPVYISSNDDFEFQGWPGTGTWSDPYKIANLTITGHTGPAICIVNVTAPFIIRNCSMSADGYKTAITFDNVTNGLIDNCSIGPAWMGFNIRSSSNITITRSVFSSGDQNGLTLNYVSNISFTENTVQNWGLRGIAASVGENITCSGNVFRNNTICMDFGQADYSSVRENLFIDGISGICLIYGESLIIESNDFVNLSGCAVIAYSTLMTQESLGAARTIRSFTIPDIKSFGGIVTANSFVECRCAFSNSFGNPLLFSRNIIEVCEIGIDLSYTSEIWVIDNTILNASRYGIRTFCGADENTFYGNSIMDCGVANAFDEGESNIWDNGLNLGNYWDNYNGTGEYIVSGPANATDRWPGRAGAPYLWVVNETEVDFGSQGETLKWMAFDSDPLSYEITRNGTLFGSGVWDGGNLTVSLDGLAVGTHVFVATVFDEEGHSTTASTVVWVIPSSTSEYSTSPTTEISSITLVIAIGSGITIGLVALMIYMRRSH